MKPLGEISVPYSSETRRAIHDAMPPGRVGVDVVCELDTVIGQEFAAVAEQAQSDLCGGKAELVSSHGQTLFHWVEDGAARGSLQLGQRRVDYVGNGASGHRGPPIGRHRSGGPGSASPARSTTYCWVTAGPRHAALNLGGIANVTIVGDELAPVASTRARPTR